MDAIALMLTEGGLQEGRNDAGKLPELNEAGFEGEVNPHQQEDRQNRISPQKIIQHYEY